MKRSAGLLMFRRHGGALEVLLAHPGGPFWQHRDAGAWTIPKGEFAEPELALDAARREFAEETGFAVTPPPLPLGDVVQKSGKRLGVWAFEGECDPAQLHCNDFELEWPPRSGRTQRYPEIDRIAWLGVAEARRQAPAGAMRLPRPAGADARALTGAPRSATCGNQGSSRGGCQPHPAPAARVPGDVRAWPLPLRPGRAQSR